LEIPYKGFTTEGNVIGGLYHYAEDEGAPTERAASKVNELLAMVTEKQREEVQRGDVTDDEIRLWSNPELYMNPGPKPVLFITMNMLMTFNRWPAS
jgi:hypothetical protein